MTSKKKKLFNKEEIIYNLINSLLAGALVFVGAFADGSITITGITIALFVSLLIFLQKFKKYWDSIKKVNTTNILNFV